MTVIIGIVRNGTVYMGTDTQTSVGVQKSNNSRKETKKIHKLRDGLLIGSSGLVRVSQLLWQHEDEFMIGEEGLTKDLIVRDIIPKMKKWLGENKLLEENGTVNNSFLLAWKDKLYAIVDRWKTIRITDRYAIGCGCDFATAKLLDVDESKSAEETLLEGLRCSTRYSSGVDAPFLLIDSKDLTFTEVEA